MSTKRVLLVYSSEIRSTVVSASLRVAPIGLFFLNGVLIEKGYETKITHVKITPFNEPFADSDFYRENLRKEIVDFNPDYIGYSFRNLFHWGIPLQNSKELVNYLSMSLEKQALIFIRSCSSAIIVGGGPAFSLEPSFYMHYLNLDYGVIGEGELVFGEFIEKHKTRQSISDIPGLVYRRGKEVIVNPHRCIGDLKNLPKMQTGNMRDYRELYYNNGGYANIQTKRGCSFGCIYCLYPYLEGGNYRLRSVKTVIEEVFDIKTLYDIRHFFITDSVFSTPSKHSMEFCDVLIESKANIEWCACINPRGITEELLIKYKRSGCHNLILTVDALSEKVLKHYRKGFSISDIKKCVQLLTEVDILFEISIILGGPGEDENTVEETAAFCDEYLRDVPILFFNGMWLHPSAPAMNILKSEGFHIDACFENIILSNDFEMNKKLRYFFPHITDNRRKFLGVIFSKIRKYKRIVEGKDMVIDWATGAIKHSPELRVIENQRPWHKGMKGRV